MTWLRTVKCECFSLYFPLQAYQQHLKHLWGGKVHSRLPCVWIECLVHFRCEKCEAFTVEPENNGCEKPPPPPEDLVAEWHIARLLQVDLCDKFEQSWILLRTSFLGPTKDKWADFSMRELIWTINPKFLPLQRWLWNCLLPFENYWGLVEQPVKSEVRQGWNAEALYAELETFRNPDILWGPGWLFLYPLLLSHCLSKSKTMTCILFFNPLTHNQCCLQVFGRSLDFCLGWIRLIKGILLNTFGKINSHTHTHRETHPNNKYSYYVTRLSKIWEANTLFF